MYLSISVNGGKPASPRIRGSQSMIVDVTPGTHTIALNLRANEGLTTARTGHRSLSVLAFDQGEHTDDSLTNRQIDNLIA